MLEVGLSAMTDTRKHTIAETMYNYWEHLLTKLSVYLKRDNSYEDMICSVGAAISICTIIITIGKYTASYYFFYMMFCFTFVVLILMLCDYRRHTIKDSRKLTEKAEKQLSSFIRKHRRRALTTPSKLRSRVQVSSESDMEEYTSGKYYSRTKAKFSKALKKRRSISSLSGT